VVVSTPTVRVTGVAVGDVAGDGAELAGAVVVAEDVVISEADLGQGRDRGGVPVGDVHLIAGVSGRATWEVAIALVLSVMLAWSG
jgi:hypothetical protein